MFDPIANVGQDRPSVYFTKPSFFGYPEAWPSVVPSPPTEHSIRAPFGINEQLFNAVLRPEVPICVATVYVTTVALLNAYNRRRGMKPWWIARQSWFKPLVLLHNALLAVYSFATSFAMIRAVVKVWPGFWNGAGAAGIADAYCRMDRTQDTGYLDKYNHTLHAVLPSFATDASDAWTPRTSAYMWSEGLAFWGWVFYLSKFYEVIDTLVILAKGKRSSTLQTYHHAGMMFCMWAGIRYMSPPIVIAPVLNGAIHTMMYTYYTLSTLGFRVPKAFKQSLTTMQIAQFLVGMTAAALPLFIRYDIPKPKFAFAPSLGLDQANASTAASQDESQWMTIDCIQTQGEIFAVWVNLFYLLPLTGLFVRFFVKSYITGPNASSKKPKAA